VVARIDQQWNGLSDEESSTDHFGLGEFAGFKLCGDPDDGYAVLVFAKSVVVEHDADHGNAGMLQANAENAASGKIPECDEEESEQRGEHQAEGTQRDGVLLKMNGAVHVCRDGERKDEQAGRPDTKEHNEQTAPNAAGAADFFKLRVVLCERVVRRWFHFHRCGDSRCLVYDTLIALNASTKQVATQIAIRSAVTFPPLTTHPIRLQCLTRDRRQLNTVRWRAAFRPRP
jgi:hypothetical protein